MEENENNINKVQNTLSCNREVAIQLIRAGYREPNISDLLKQGEDEVEQIKHDFINTANKISNEINDSINEHKRYFEEKKASK